MTYYIIKTRENDAAPRVFFILKQEDVPKDEQEDVIHLACNSVRRFTGVTQLMNYLEQNTSNALHETEPYILRKITWNQAIDKFGFDYDTETDDTESTESQ